MVTTAGNLTSQIDVALATIEGNLSMYMLSKVASQLLGRHVREQQFYNYRHNGMMKNLVDGRMTKEDAKAFLTKFCSKRI